MRRANEHGGREGASGNSYIRRAWFMESAPSDQWNGSSAGANCETAISAAAATPSSPAT
jgi:hypothetical protein